MAQNKAYYEASKEKVLAQSKAYRIANKEKVSARKKAHYEANKEKMLAQSKAYRVANRTKVAEASRQHGRERYGIKPKPGTVYIVENVLVPGWVKIGRTTRSLFIRLRSFNGSFPKSLPSCFVAHVHHTQNCFDVELAAHDILHENRDPAGGEWFKVTLEQAIEAVTIASFKHDWEEEPAW